MGFIKRKMTNVRNKAGTTVANSLRYLFPWVFELKSKYKIDARIRKANMQANKKPKKFFYSCLAAFGVLLLINILLFFIPHSKNMELPSAMETSAEVNNVIQTMGKIQSIKEKQNKEVANLTIQAYNLNREVDSLSKIKDKTKEDSMKIMSNYHKMKIISNSLNIGKK